MRSGPRFHLLPHGPILRRKSSDSRQAFGAILPVAIHTAEAPCTRRCCDPGRPGDGRVGGCCRRSSEWDRRRTLLAIVENTVSCQVVHVVDSPNAPVDISPSVYIWTTAFHSVHQHHDQDVYNKRKHSRASDRYQAYSML